MTRGFSTNRSEKPGPEYAIRKKVYKMQTELPPPKIFERARLERKSSNGQTLCTSTTPRVAYLGNDPSSSDAQKINGEGLGLRTWTCTELKTLESEEIGQVGSVRVNGNNRRMVLHAQPPGRSCVAFFSVTFGIVSPREILRCAQALNK
jgi:hypothetical protein